MMKLKIFLMLLSVVVVFSCRKKSSDDYEYYKKDLKDSVMVADTIQSATLPDTTVVATETSQEVTVRGVDLNDQFFLVVASYAVEEYAMAKKAELETQGMKPEVFMINEDGWYKLAVESYATYQDARSALGILREKGGLFGNAVIVSKKSKS